MFAAAKIGNRFSVVHLVLWFRKGVKKIISKKNQKAL
jgi:hypothetical protein